MKEYNSILDYAWYSVTTQRQLKLGIDLLLRCFLSHSGGSGGRITGEGSSRRPSLKRCLIWLMSLLSKWTKMQNWVAKTNSWKTDHPLSLLS